MYSHQEILDFENEMKELEADLGKVQHRYVDEQKEEIVTPIILYSPSPTHFTLRNKITSFIQAQFFTDAYQLGVPLVTMCVNFRNAPHHTQAEKEARITQAKVTLRLIAFLHCIPDANQQVVNGVKVLKGTPEYSDKINIAGQPFKDIRDQLPKLDPTAANGINWGDPTPKMFARGVRSAIIEPVTDDAFNRFVPDLKDPNKDPNKEGYSNAKCDHFFHALKLDEEIQSALAIITIYHSKLTSLLTKHHADKDKSSAKALSEKIKILDTASEKLITLLKALNEDFKKNKNNVTKMRKQLYETLRACHKLLGEKPTQMSLETAQLVLRAQVLLFPTEIDNKLSRLKSSTGSDKGSDKGSNKGSDKASVHSAASAPKSSTTIDEGQPAHQRTASLTPAQKSTLSSILARFGTNTSASVGPPDSSSGKLSTMATGSVKETKQHQQTTSQADASSSSSHSPLGAGFFAPPGTTPPGSRTSTPPKMSNSAPSTPRAVNSSSASSSTSNTLNRSMSSTNLTSEGSDSSLTSGSIASAMSLSSSTISDGGVGKKTPGKKK